MLKGRTNPPCTICTQREEYCQHKQIKHLSKGCQVLMGHIVENGADYSVVSDVASIIQPGWYTRNSETRRTTVCKRILKDLINEEVRMKSHLFGEHTSNSRYNRERKRNVKPKNVNPKPR